MSILDEPHYEIPAAELAAWIEEHGAETYWGVDGDYRLSGRMFLPVPGDEFAADLRRINLPLLVLDPQKNPEVRGQVIGRNDLDALVRREGDGITFPEERPIWADDRYFEMRWKDKDWDFILSEDLDATDFWRRDALEAEQE